MHRAVAYGNAEDIKNLIDFQAPYTLRTSKLLWTPIFVAAQFGNMQTFNELRKHHPDLLDMKDIRGWTLLHVAVNAKRTELIRLLVSLGADPHACSRATKFLVPDDLKEVAVTPGDIAMLRGKGIFDAYVESLRMQGYELEVKGNEPEEEREVFWPSVEKMEILGSESVVTN
jgi:ankyrin repeat protein